MDKNLDDNKKILFSIIIPTYNRSAFILKTIAGFLDQTYSYFELIIVDDGSTDNTAEVISTIKDERVKYFHKENGERGAARNFGAKQAAGDYINYFDSDDIAYPNHLELAYTVAIKLQQPMLFHLGYEMKNEKGEFISRPKPIKGIGNEKMLRVNYINPNPLFVHRNTLNEVEYNGDRNLSATEDWLYHLQLAARYDLIAYDDTVTSCMIQHANRSMNTYSGEAVLKRNDLLLHYLKLDERFIAKYGNRLHTVSAEMHGLAALHFVLEKKKIKAIQNLLKSFWLSPVLVFKRRTLAIIKYIFI
ncbi:MAG: glycosyltransferase family 2 protein [Ferruginibacter sp.]